MSNDQRRFAPATNRNREPILDVLQRFVAKDARVLEVASGSGEHAMWLAPRLGVASWQPTDFDADALASIDAWRAHDEVAMSILPALELDVTEWPASLLSPAFDLVFCANMIHISPWRCCEGLIDGAAKALRRPGGLLYLYGPYKRDGRHTAPSNEAFDESLRARDPEWGIRDLEQVTTSAAAKGFALVEVIGMPANNLSVILRLE